MPITYSRSSCEHVILSYIFAGLRWFQQEFDQGMARQTLFYYLLILGINNAQRLFIQNNMTSFNEP